MSQISGILCGILWWRACPTRLQGINDMQINGNPVLNGTIVVAPGEQAAIRLPSGLLAVEFRTDPGAARIDFISGTMVFFNMNNPLGSAASTTVTPAGEAPIQLRVALYAIGEGAGAYHVLHYTIG